MGPLRACSRRLYAMCCSLLPRATVPWSALGPPAGQEWGLEAHLPAKLEHLTSLTLVDDGQGPAERAPRQQLARLLWLQGNAPSLQCKLESLALRDLRQPLQVASALSPHAMRALRRVDLGDVQGGPGGRNRDLRALRKAPALSHLRFTSPEPELDLSPLSGIAPLRCLDFASTLASVNRRMTEVTRALVTQLTRLDIDVTPDLGEPWEPDVLDATTQCLCKELVMDLRLAGMFLCEDSHVQEDQDDSIMQLRRLTRLTALTRLVLAPCDWHIRVMYDYPQTLLPSLINLQRLYCTFWVPLGHIKLMKHLHTVKACSVCDADQRHMHGSEAEIWDGLPALQHLMLDKVGTHSNSLRVFRRAASGAAEAVEVSSAAELEMLWRTCDGDGDAAAGAAWGVT